MQRTDTPIQLTRRQEELWEHHFELCESPIERTFLGSYLCLLDRATRSDPDNAIEPVVSSTELGADMTVAGLFDLDPLLDRADVIVIQPEVGNFRPDFVLWRVYADPAGGDPMPSVKAIVECDGHDFHERTKEQAARDKSRDRQLQAQGYYVLRFTGSELWNNSNGCAREADEFLTESAYRAAAKRHKFPA